MTTGTPTAKFAPGQVIVHRLFEYRGVVVDVDPYFKGSDMWYQNVAQTRPPKDRPWYHVLVDGVEQRTYVAERNLQPDVTGEPVTHVDMEQYFDGMGKNGYILRRKDN